MAALLLVDLSYLIFAKYFSSLTWYRSVHNPAPNIPDIMSCQPFVERFTSSMLQAVAKEARYRRAACTILARDCSKDMVWRRQIFPEYKLGRAYNSNFNRGIFQHTYSTVVPQIISTVGEGMCAVVSSPSAEADDVIAVASQECLRSEVSHVYILSNDNDYLQLIDDYTSVYNLSGKDIGHRRDPGVTPQEYLARRLTSGDRSDNIPGAIEGTPEHARNTTLMDLHKQPPDIRFDIRCRLHEAFPRIFSDPSCDPTCANR